MKKTSFCSFLLALALSCVTSASAQLITPTAVTGSGFHLNPFSRISDGVIPAEGSVWLASTNVWWLGFDTSITLDFGYKYRVNDLLVSVDNNDRYNLDYSLDGLNYTSLLTIRPSYGEMNYGMDTMSTVSTSSEYVAQIDFFPFVARYLRIRAVAGGDMINAVGELQAFGSPVPEASTYGVIGAAALLGLAAFRRRR